MLDNDTKRRIDTARDILVGKVPDPKSQVEQITIALIYKFMDDMDAEAEELGGERSFFQGEYAEYAWHRLLAPDLSSHAMLNRYSEALVRISQNPHIPQLFRDIFKNAFLPYRDPETLKHFLKEINGFTYDHSERLGDAFEYLLLVMAAQGDAGQFRTPRHIIDFMVAAIDPQKHERVLDPACGTAGFLISAYKHILAANSRDGRAGGALRPDERARLAQNILGYDISPDMVRLSLVNLYLHGFSHPQIYEYDTLTSETRWQEDADVILANPPFMSPKGGIRPHKRFSVQSKRSEVLFVDYIAEHLSPNGRGAVVVPEGIIFQSQSAYKQLRKMLVERYLFGVVSLPAGVFQPYSGVKTSILLFDKSLAKRSDAILFVKIEADGYDLGAQRRAIERSDLPEALRVIQTFQRRIRNGETLETDAWPNALLVPRAQIAANGDYNLSGERYRHEEVRSTKYEVVELGEVAEVISGQSPSSEFYNEHGNGLPFYQGKTEFGQVFIGEPKQWTTQITREAYKNDILMSVRAPVGPVNLATQKICIGRGLAAIRPKEKVKYLFLFYLLKSIEDKIVGGGGSVFDSISRKQIEQIKIPLPPLEVQAALVAEIEGYQRIIDGARQVVENYKPQIKIDPAWEMVEIENVSLKITKGSSPNWQGINYTDSKEGILFITSENVGKGELLLEKRKYVEKQFNEIEKRSILQKGDVLTNIVGASIGRTAIYDLHEVANINQAVCLIRLNEERVNKKFFAYYLNSDEFIHRLLNNKVENARANISMGTLGEMKIPLPDLATQQRIAAQIEEEQALVAANTRLVALFEQKIRAAVAALWSAPGARSTPD